MFNHIISDLRKGCGRKYGYSEHKCGQRELDLWAKPMPSKIILCEVCNAKLDQTLLCEKIANENQKRLKAEIELLKDDLCRLEQKHKDFVEKLKIAIWEDDFMGWHNKKLLEHYSKILAELESEVGNG